MLFRLPCFRACAKGRWPCRRQGRRGSAVSTLSCNRIQLPFTLQAAWRVCVSVAASSAYRYSGSVARVNGNPSGTKSDGIVPKDNAVKTIYLFRPGLPLLTDTYPARRWRRSYPRRWPAPSAFRCCRYRRSPRTASPGPNGPPGPGPPAPCRCIRG